MFNMPIVVEKPLPHLSLSDWNARVNQLCKVADARRTDALTIQQSSRRLRNETRIASDWANYETNEALVDRISECRRWRELIAGTAERIEKEIKNLQHEKNLGERYLESMVTPIGIITEALAVRDLRSGSELTYDEPDTEIKNELALMENTQRLLADQCQKAWEKLKSLDILKSKLKVNIDYKAEAERLDTAQLALNKTAAIITFKPDPLRIPKNSYSYEEWLEYIKNVRQMAENELFDTFATREALFMCREKAKNMLQSQQERTEHVIRKRIFDTQRVFNELDWQRTKMKDAMEHALCEIKTLEQALRDKTDGFKLAQTRLENRAQRSGMELCLDEAHDSLCLEVEKLKEIRKRLINKIDEAKFNYNLLEDHAQKIDVDLENKRYSLDADQRLLNLRQRLKCGDHGEPKEPSIAAQTDRNLVLTSMESDIAKK